MNCYKNLQNEKAKISQKPNELLKLCAFSEPKLGDFIWPLCLLFQGLSCTRLLHIALKSLDSILLKVIFNFSTKFVHIIFRTYNGYSFNNRSKSNIISEKSKSLWYSLQYLILLLHVPISYLDYQDCRVSNPATCIQSRYLRKSELSIPQDPGICRITLLENIIISMR